jgi:hypothetical protein
MSKTAQGAAAPVRKTQLYPFFSCNPARDALFAVREGVPALDALQQASCFLEAARDAAYSSASSDEPLNAMWATAYLVDVAKAVVDAAIDAMYDEERGHE